MKQAAKATGLIPLLIVGLLLLPGCTSRENLTTNSVRKLTMGEIEKAAASELKSYKFEKYVCSGPQMIQKRYSDLSTSLSKSWFLRNSMVDLENNLTDKIKIDISNANAVMGFIANSIILQNDFCFTDEQITNAKEGMEILAKTRD